jgi:hypothetical protein
MTKSNSYSEKIKKSFKKKYYEYYLKIDFYSKFNYKEESCRSFSRPSERYLAPSTPILLLLFKIIKEKLKAKIKKKNL